MSGTAPSGDDDVCLTDLDCTGAEVCYVSELPWTNGTARCDCIGWYGKWGPGCDELTPYFYVSVLAIAASVCAASALAVRSMRDVRRVCKLLGGVTKSSSNATPVFTTAALLAVAGWKLSCLLEFLVPIRGAMVFVTQKGEKTTLITRATDVMQLLVTLFCMLSLLNLSLMWIEVSRTAIRINARTSRRMNIYRTTCIVIGTTTVAGNLTMLALHQVMFAMALGMPLAVSLGIVFIIGRRSMDKMINESLPLPGPGTKDFAKRLEKLSDSIRRCCNQTVFWIFAFVSSSALWFFVMVIRPPLTGWREYTLPGVGCWPQLTYELVPFATLGVLRTQYLYSHDNIAGRLADHPVARRTLQAKGDATTGASTNTDTSVPATLPVSSTDGS